MKRLGGIFDLVIDRENLAAAFHRVAKGRRNRRDVASFAADLEENLNTLRRELADGFFRFGAYNFFRITDPKPRTIAAAPVRERVVHHAIIAVIGGRLERALIDKSYACRKGKGQWAAVAEARRLAHRHEWCLKLDIKSFFDSIDHEILMRLLARKIKDRRVMTLLRQLVESYETAPGKGLPIGNLTSQYFANLYLDGLDRWLARAVDCNRLQSIRYMDDLLVFGGREALRRVMGELPAWLAENLSLTLKPTGGLHRTARGVDFLGTRVFPDRVALSRRSKVRFRRRLAALDAAFDAGLVGERRYQDKATQFFAFARNCDSVAFRRKVISESGQKGEAPRHSRRLLERQQQRGLCRRLPLRLPLLQREQQHEPGQCQRLLGPARCLPPASSTTDGADANRPLSRSPGAAGGQRAIRPGGAGRRHAERHAGIFTPRTGRTGRTGFQPVYGGLGANRPTDGGAIRCAEPGTDLRKGADR